MNGEERKLVRVNILVKLLFLFLPLLYCGDVTAQDKKGPVSKEDTRKQREADKAAYKKKKEAAKAQKKLRKQHLKLQSKEVRKRMKKNMRKNNKGHDKRNRIHNDRVRQAN